MRSLLLLPLLSSISLAQPELPNPLKQADGKIITTSAEWEKTLRSETLQLFRENVYGITPIGKPADFKVRVVEEIPDALDGKATIKQIEITFSGPHGSGKILPIVVLPNAVKKPAPAFLLINNRNRPLLDPANPNEFFPMREIIDRGYAAVGFMNQDVDPDAPDQYEKGIRKVFNEGPPAANAWATLAAWAWAASRIMDYIETEPRIDAKHVAVVGHSRGGKTALWAGAEDPRFALVISNNSGAGGASPARITRGETIAQLNDKFPHWFNANYKNYNGRDKEMPFDQHQLIALIAPRLAYVASAASDSWADPNAEFAGALGASAVYQLYGLKTLAGREMPGVNAPLQDSSVGYHVRTGKHDLTLVDWKHFMDFADRHWVR